MYLGLDIHKNICVVTQMNEQGKVVRKEKIGVDKEEIEDFFFSIERALGQNSTLVFEYDPKALREAQKASGRGMKGVEIEKLEERLQMR